MSVRDSYPFGRAQGCACQVEPIHLSTPSLMALSGPLSTLFGCALRIGHACMEWHDLKVKLELGTCADV